MKYIAAALLLVSCTPASHPPIDAPITAVTAPEMRVERGRSVAFVRKPWVVGDEILDASRTSTTIRFSEEEGATSIEEIHRIRKSMRVAEVDGDRISAMDVHYDEWENDGPVGRAVTLTGKDYIVRARHESTYPQVRDSKNAIVPADETKEVAKSMKADLRPDPLGTALAGRTVHIDEDVPTAAAALTKHFTETAEPDQREMTVIEPRVTLLRIEGDIATFQMSLKLTWVQESAPLTMELEGEAQVSVRTSRTKRFELHGKFDWILRPAGPTPDQPAYGGHGDVTLLSTQTEK